VISLMPSCMVVGWSTCSDIPPLGTENPTAGKRPVPNEGGLSAGEAPHDGSGVDESR
jgi:hypothetical protein